MPFFSKHTSIRLQKPCTHRLAWGALCVLAASASVPAFADEGWRIMTDKSLGNCWACHALPGQQGLVSNLGPSLAGVGARLSTQQLMQWVVDARQIHPQTLMPPFGVSTGLQRTPTPKAVLTPDEIQQVVNTLAKWQ
jgi:sulfur-oxidizing protein SoxX